MLMCMAMDFVLVPPVSSFRKVHSLTDPTLIELSRLFKFVYLGYTVCGAGGYNMSPISFITFIVCVVCVYV